MHPEERSYQEFVHAIAPMANEFDRVGKLSWESIGYAMKEPDMVRAYLLSSDKGIDRLNQDLCAPFVRKNKRFSLKFSSVFIHQRPLVLGDGASNECELGDLCTIFVYLDKHKNIRHARATLAQAKKGVRLALPRGSDQRTLYEVSGHFDYKAHAFYTNTASGAARRELPSYSKGRALALKFLLLHPQYRNQVISPPLIASRHHGWGSSLFRLVLAADGLQFFPGKPAADRWSAILDDLIRMGLGAIRSTRRGAGSPRANRSQLGEILDEFNHFDNYKHFSAEASSPDFTGLPLLLVIAQDNELEANDNSN